MKTCYILIGLIFLFFVSAPFVQGAQEGITLDVKKHSDRVLTINVQGELIITALNSKKGIVVVDTTISPVLAKLVRARIEEEFGRKEFAYVINTHSHGDHTYGNQVFKDVPIIAHQKCPEDMKKDEQRRTDSLALYKTAAEQMKAGLEKMDAESNDAKAMSRRIAYFEAVNVGLGEGFVLTLPTLTFSDSLSLDLGDMSLDLFSPGDDPYIDSERLMYLPRWMDNLKKIIGTEGESKLIIPGHGEFISFGDIKNVLTFAEKTRETYAGRESAFNVFKKIYSESGLQAALKTLKEMKGQEDKFYVLFPEIDQYAYYKMLDNKLDEALAIFNVMAEMFPESDTAFDSLGEVYMRKGNTEMAVASFKKSLELNPDNRNASAKLKTLEKKK